MNRRTVILLLAAALGVTGCAPSEQERAPEPPAGQRRADFRETLRAKLGTEYDALLPPATDESIRHGSRLYDLLCRACHGPTGTGNGRSGRLLTIAPPDLTDPGNASFFSDRAKLAIIADGIDGTPMIGWSVMLAESERIDVLHFMNTLVQEPQIP